MEFWNVGQRGQNHCSTMPMFQLKAAKQIGLTIPVRVLERANQVIK